MTNLKIITKRVVQVALAALICLPQVAGAMGAAAVKTLAGSASLATAGLAGLYMGKNSSKANFMPGTPVSLSSVPYMPSFQGTVINLPTANGKIEMLESALSTGFKTAGSSLTYCLNTAGSSLFSGLSWMAGHPTIVSTIVVGTGIIVTYRYRNQIYTFITDSIVNIGKDLWKRISGGYSADAAAKSEANGLEIAVVKAKVEALPTEIQAQAERLIREIKACETSLRDQALINKAEIIRLMAEMEQRLTELLSHYNVKREDFEKIVIKRLDAQDLQLGDLKEGQQEMKSQLTAILGLLSHLEDGAASAQVSPRGSATPFAQAGHYVGLEPKKQAPLHKQPFRAGLPASSILAGRSRMGTPSPGTPRA